MEWSSDPKGVFGTPSNAVSPAFWRMLRDVSRFNSDAPRLLDEPGTETLTLGDYLDREGFSTEFREFYLSPMVRSHSSARLRLELT